MTNEFEQVEFANNPEPRCPCLLLLDTSGSMSGKPIEELNAGLATLHTELNADSIAAKRVDLAVVTFGPVRVEAEFTAAQSFQPPHLTASGNTPMGEAIESGLRMLRARKDSYKANGISYYRAWVFLITDGGPTDSIVNAKELIKAGEGKKEFTFYAVGVENADINTLASLTVGAPPLKLKGLSFGELFKWLSSSLSAVSQSNPGDEVPLDTTKLGRWAVAG
jgi:uncharacterized protein YegL